MHQQQTRNKNKRRGERGSILATTALSMVSLILAAGLAIDVSHFYTAKAELQNAADAAALAAASQMNSTAGGINSAVYEMPGESFGFVPCDNPAAGATLAACTNIIPN